MVEYLKEIVIAQMEAALRMLDDCVRKCPPGAWEGNVALVPFWRVAFHTLYFVDYYLSPSEAEFAPRPFHEAASADGSSEADSPAGVVPLAVMLDYVAICRRKAVEEISAETEDSLRAAAQFRRRESMSRGELHLYNLRHVQHHVGQLSAYVRRVAVSVDPRWFGRGWPGEP